IVRNFTILSTVPTSFDGFHLSSLFSLLLFFFNTPATTEIYTLSLHDALPISRHAGGGAALQRALSVHRKFRAQHPGGEPDQKERSEEHTSELQSLAYLVCRLLLEKKKERDSD